MVALAAMALRESMAPTLSHPHAVLRATWDEREGARCVERLLDRAGARPVSDHDVDLEIAIPTGHLRHRTAAGEALEGAHLEDVGVRPAHRVEATFAADADAFTLSVNGWRNYPFRRVPGDVEG